MTTGANSNTARFRFPSRATPYVFAFYMATIMAFLMCLVITLAEFGIDEHYMENVMNAYRVAMPSAFFCVMVVRPLVARLVAWTVHRH
ncbi:DUF2798 domain-containing protein [Pseudomonas capsici]|uniref:DUF2798 domain-containing protein n=1 Tax=Pseudomonas capsici TaxID=2810614 RepID=UPI0019107645|nr:MULTISPECIES: DUF2798 domain-containing protein [Pseudomonas]MCV4265907.1 DUF2798 domain-containing protein [Pseudomonas capsici]MCV4291502.1 DUF2798 domain-containing protein [Pseudomonas capsici]GFM53792.1 hypothetical protein PSCICE_50590 [Pseudomonas cichorii]GFM56358.1 hypothetical protein PSCICF_25360 [Pseudomonas cichorii]GFM61228.1 hypothetical protein PSCICG_23880 [Pseudomonas cichorii]